MDAKAAALRMFHRVYGRNPRDDQEFHIFVKSTIERARRESKQRTNDPVWKMIETRLNQREVDNDPVLGVLGDLPEVWFNEHVEPLIRERMSRPIEIGQPAATGAGDEQRNEAQGKVRKQPLEIPTDIAHFKAEFEHWLSFQTMPSGYHEASEKRTELIPYFAEHAGRGAVWLGIRTTEWLRDRRDELPGSYPVNIKLREPIHNRTRVTIYTKPDFAPFGDKLDQWVRANWLAQPVVNSGGEDEIEQEALRRLSQMAESAQRWQRPGNGASREDWYRYKYECDKSAVVRFTHQMLAAELSLSVGTVRNYYSAWLAEHSEIVDTRGDTK